MRTGGCGQVTRWTANSRISTSHAQKPPVRELQNISQINENRRTGGRQLVTGWT